MLQELLEAYLIDFNSLASKVEYLRSQIQSAEESVSLRLDTSRNELLIINTGLAVAGCSIAFSAYLSGGFGMNLDNTEWLPIHGSFAGVFGGTLALIPVTATVVFSYLTKKGMLPQRTKPIPCSKDKLPAVPAVEAAKKADAHSHSSHGHHHHHLHHGHHRHHFHHHHQLHSYVSHGSTVAAGTSDHKVVENPTFQQ